MSYRSLKTPLRNQLKTAGLIEVRRQSRSMIPVLTEEGWYALEENLGAPISNAGATATVLRAILAGLARQIQQGTISLSDVVAETESFPASVVKQKASLSDNTIVPTDVKRRLFDACRRIAGDGVYNVRIRLADLRVQLADVPRPAVDDALKELERNEDAALYTLDDPREIRPDDEEAALSTSSGAKRHILYLSRPR
jgi:hypothetical protein